MPELAGTASPFVEGSIVGTNDVYNLPAQRNIEPPTGFWSDLGGIGSPGFAMGTAGPGGYREPFITETVFYNNVGVTIKRQTYSFSFGYDHTNDFILIRHVLTNTGDVDVNLDGFFEATNQAVRNLCMVVNYNFDIASRLDPTSTVVAEVPGNDDQAPTAFFANLVPQSRPERLPNSGRYNVPPYGSYVYSGIVSAFDSDDLNIPGIDTYVWSNQYPVFNPLHCGTASLLVLEGNGASPHGDLDAPIKKTVWGGPSVGLFQTHQLWNDDVVGVGEWYTQGLYAYLAGHGSPPVGSIIQWPPSDHYPNPDFFTAGAEFDALNVPDVGLWTPKPEVAALTSRFGDPRQPGILGGSTKPPYMNPAGRYDNITLYDLEGPFQSVAPNPYEGSDRKEVTSTIGRDLRTMIGWGPFDLDVGESLTVWQVDLVGAGFDGIYDVYLRAQDVWMQRKYNPANDTYYWDGSNDRIIPDYAPDGRITGIQTVNPGRSPDSGALFFPPPAPILSVFPTAQGTIMLAWVDNAETAIDPGTGKADIQSYRIYRSSGFIDQFPGVTIPHPIGYNTTILPPNMGLDQNATTIADVTNPLYKSIRDSHPYARFIHEGNTICADYNIGGAFDFITADLKTFTPGSFAGPYVQIAEFPVGGGASMFDPPERVRVPNPMAPEDRFSGYKEDTIEVIPSARQIVDVNRENKAQRNDVGDAAIPLTFPTDRHGATPFYSVEDLEMDPQLSGRHGYMWEDTFTLLGFNYWYYVAAVDGESAVHRDFDSVLQNSEGSSQEILKRRIDGLESFYTMNANGTDGLWHGTFPFRGWTVGPPVPGQEVVPQAIFYSHWPYAPLDQITVAPNPFDFQALWDLAAPGRQSVRFFQVPLPACITIFDTAGMLIRRIEAKYNGRNSAGVEWDLKNMSNVPVSAGLYIAVIEIDLRGRTVTKTLKLYIRR